MNAEEIRNYCLAQKGVTEGFPFGESALVFKVMGKMWALLNIDKVPLYFCLKCDPDWAIELREQHHEIEGAYHMNKQHWNGIRAETLEPELIKKMIHHSYDLVVSKFPKKLKAELDAL